MREMRGTTGGKIPAEERNKTEGRVKKNKAGGGELNILRWIELKLSRNNANWRGV